MENFGHIFLFWRYLFVIFHAIFRELLRKYDFAGINFRERPKNSRNGEYFGWNWIVTIPYHSPASKSREHLWRMILNNTYVEWYWTMSNHVMIYFCQIMSNYTSNFVEYLKIVELCRIMLNYAGVRSGVKCSVCPMISKKVPSDIVPFFPGSTW